MLRKLMTATVCISKWSSYQYETIALNLVQPSAVRLNV